MTFLISRILLTSLAMFSTAASQPGTPPSALQPVLYPEWVPLLNVKKFGATGDGRTDDTAAIQRAIQSGGWDRELYFPPGVYLLSKTLEGLNAKGKPLGWLQFYGAGKAFTTLRLINHCEGFQNPAEPKAVVRFRGNITKESGTAREQPNVAFFNSVYDLTVDVGAGNPGAVGIDWVVCNSGSLRHVNVISSDPERRGFAGVRMASNDGTSYMRDVSILGFDYGWWRGAHAQCLAVEGLQLRKQRKAGIFNLNSVFSLHDLRSENSVPTLMQVDNTAAASILNARITGGASPAIVQTTARSLLYLRDVRTVESSVLVETAGAAALPGPVLEGEWFSHPPASAAPPVSIGLPIKQAPEFHNNDASSWARVADFSDGGSGDYSVRLQKAIDSGAETIVMDPGGSGKYRTPVTVRGKVRRIIGFWQSSRAAKHATFKMAAAVTLSLDPAAAASVDPEHWFMRIEGDGSEPLIIEQFHHFPGGILNSSGRPLVLRDMGVAAYANTPQATGDLFTESVMGARYQIRHGQHAWLRSTDAVFGDGPDFLIDGSTAWFLSNRTEGGGVFVEATNRAAVEIIGTTHFIGSRGVGQDIAYVSRDSDFALINFSEIGFGKEVYQCLVSDLRAGQETRVLRKSPGVTSRAGRSGIMFYRSGAK